MILHKYIEKEFGLETVKNLELKVSVPVDFNDPFEFMPRDVGVWSHSIIKNMVNSSTERKKILDYLKSNAMFNNRVERKKQYKLKKNEYIEELKKFFTKEQMIKMAEEVKKNAGKTIKIICFSSDETNDTQQILLWSHYTYKHCGFKLYFDSTSLIEDRGYMEKVIYKPERPEIDTTLLRFYPNMERFEIKLKDTIMVKANIWEYEKEYRVFITKGFNYNSEKKLHFYKFNPKSLIRIDLGINCSIEIEKEILNELNTEEKAHIDVYRCKINPEEYKIDYVPINKNIR